MMIVTVFKGYSNKASQTNQNNDCYCQTIELMIKAHYFTNMKAILWPPLE